MVRALQIIILCLIAATSCTKKKSADPAPNTYVRDNLATSKWRLYQYQLNQTTAPIAVNDTLIFTTDKDYTYNKQACTYNYEKNESAQSCRLTLNNTPYGNIVGYPAFSFSTYGSIQGVSFTQLTLGNPQTYILWLQKI